MREASITLPLFDNSGVSLAAVHGELRYALTDAFNGYSALAIDGAWKDEDTGKLYSESSTRYVVAADWQANPRLERRLCAIAARFATLARQLCVYVILPSGEVAFIADSEQQAPAAQSAAA